MHDSFYSRDSEETPDFLKGQGNILLGEGRIPEAEHLYRRAVELDPGYMPAHYNLGNVLRMQSRFEEALAAYETALGLAPDDYDIFMNIGATLIDLFRPEDALQKFCSASEFMPSAAEPLINMGVAYWQLGQMGKPTALPAYFMASDLPAALRAHQDHDNFDMAVECYEKALLIKPDCSETHYNMGIVLKSQSRLDLAIESFRKSLSLNPGFVDAHSSLLFTMQYLARFTAKEIFAEHLRFAEQFEAPLKPFWPVHKNLPEPGRRLKVGYVSGDFRSHAVTYFFEPILANHDRSCVEVFCYYNNTIHDDITDRIIAMADHWIPCKSMTDGHLAERIIDDRIDILVDLAGHTTGNRLLTFARKPAPVQVTWIGYPGTTGLAAMDYRLTDGFMDPVGMTEQYHTETLLRLPSSFTFQPAAESPPTNALPAMTSGQFTFACLNNLIKVSREVISLWAGILTALPHSRLILGNVNGIQVRQRLLDMFAQEGIAAERLELYSTMALDDYLALHHQVDMALDPFPYNGGTSTLHSLWMGVPVITLAGQNTASRQGAAAMAWLDLIEFVTTSQNEYVERTLEFSRDLPRLNQIRQSLRERMRTQSDVNPMQLTRNLEETYRTIWKEWCEAGSGA